MNPYDDAVKALCAADLTGLCRWLGVTVTGPARPVRLAESAPATGTRTVDLLVSANTDTLAHVEFQTWPEPRFPQRMLDYWLRLDAAPERGNRIIEQHVVVLGPRRLPDRLDRPGLRFRYRAHHLADEDPDQFLADPSLVPFAVLARMEDGDRPAMLATALRLITLVRDERLQEIFARAAVDLAAIHLPAATINSIWEESAMPIPSILNQRYQEGRAEGLEKGLEKGLEAGLVTAAASLLRVRFGDDERIDPLAGRLAGLGAAGCMARIENARSLDELV